MSSSLTNRGGAHAEQWAIQLNDFLQQVRDAAAQGCVLCDPTVELLRAAPDANRRELAMADIALECPPCSGAFVLWYAAGNDAGAFNSARALTLVANSLVRRAEEADRLGHSCVVCDDPGNATERTLCDLAQLAVIRPIGIPALLAIAQGDVAGRCVALRMLAFTYKIYSDHWRLATREDASPEWLDEIAANADDVVDRLNTGDGDWLDVAQTLHIVARLDQLWRSGDS